MYVYDVFLRKDSYAHLQCFIGIVTKLKTKHRFHIAPLLLYILKKYCLDKSCIFLKDAGKKTLMNLNEVVLMSLPSQKSGKSHDIPYKAKIIYLKIMKI